MVVQSRHQAGTTGQQHSPALQELDRGLGGLRHMDIVDHVNPNYRYR